MMRRARWLATWLATWRAPRRAGWLALTLAAGCGIADAIGVGGPDLDAAIERACECLEAEFGGDYSDCVDEQQAACEESDCDEVAACINDAGSCGDVLDCIGVAQAGGGG